MRPDQLVCRTLWSDLDAFWRRAITRPVNRQERRMATRHVLTVARTLRAVRSVLAVTAPAGARRGA